MKTDKEKEVLLEQLRKTPIVQVACNHAGVARSTYYRWFNEDKDFKQKAEEALSEGVKLINDLAESKLIANINEQNMTAIIFWLKSHSRAKYGDKLEVSAKSESEPLTEEQKVMIEKALSLSPLKLSNNNAYEEIRSTNNESSNDRPEDPPSSSS